MTKPILVTGGAGFIGSHLIDLFEVEKVKYIVIDNLSSGSIQNIPAAVQKDLFVEGNVNDYPLMERLINSASCVIHMASNVGVKNVISNPLENIETNINSLKNIALKCAVTKIPLIYFSTSLVYSSYKERKELFSENEQTHALGLHPVSIYESSKRTGELICEYYKQEKGLKYIIVRPFNMIGIRQSSESGMVVPSFIKSAILNKTINVYGSGKQTRSFSDVKMAVRLLWSLIQNEKSYSQIFNLATTDKQITILELAELLIEVLHDPIRIQFIPMSEVYGNSYKDVEYRSPSLTKLRQYVSYWGDTDLKNILKQIIDYEKLANNLN